MTPASHPRRRRWRRSLGRRIAEFWHDNRWYLLGAVAVVAIVLGIWGLIRQHHEAGSEPNATTLVYRSLKLFSLGIDDSSSDVPWQLELARFLAPLVVFTAIVGAIYAAVQRGSARARARRMRGHAIVVGLGDKGFTLAEQIDREGGDVVVCERYEHAPNVGRARHLGIPVIIADATEERTLMAAGLDRADHIVAMAGLPDANAAVAAAVLDFQRTVDPDAKGKLRSFIEIRDTAVVRELQAALDHERARYRQEFFNLEDRAAQALVGKFDAIWEAPRSVAAPGPILVVGLGELGCGTIVELARRWDVVRLEAGGAHRSTPLHVIALTPDDGSRADHVIGRLRARYPKIKAADGAVAGAAPACVVDVVALDPANPRPAVERAVAMGGGSFDHVALTIDDESLQVRMALMIRAELADSSSKVVVTARHREGLAGLVQSAVDIRPALTLFPIMESVCRDDEITQGRLAAMARSIHEGYRRNLAATDGIDATPARANVEWNDLDADLRQQNVEAAQATWDALASVGLRVIPLHDEEAEQFQFSADELEHLAALEHRRWFQAKHPGADPPAWDTVAPEDQRKTRQQICEIPRMLAFAGLQIACVDRSAGPTTDDRTALGI